MGAGTNDSRRQVLLLAADRGLGEALEAELKDAGFALDFTTDPEQARQRASLRCHSAYVVDASLPEGAGFRFVAELREAGSQEPVLLLSAPHAPEDMLSAQRGWPDWQPVVREGLHDAPEVLRALLRHEQPKVPGGSTTAGAAWTGWSGVRASGAARCDSPRPSGGSSRLCS